jgi:hypothetical protein
VGRGGPAGRTAVSTDAPSERLLVWFGSVEGPAEVAETVEPEQLDLFRWQAEKLLARGQMACAEAGRPDLAAEMWIEGGRVLFPIDSPVGDHSVLFRASTLSRTSLGLPAPCRRCYGTLASHSEGRECRAP